MNVSNQFALKSISVLRLEWEQKCHISETQLVMFHWCCKFKEPEFNRVEFTLYGYYKLGEWQSQSWIVEGELLVKKVLQSEWAWKSQTCDRSMPQMTEASWSTRWLLKNLSLCSTITLLPLMEGEWSGENRGKQVGNRWRKKQELPPPHLNPLTRSSTRLQYLPPPLCSQ